MFVKSHRSAPMSWNPILDPSIPIGDAVDAIETVIVPRARDLGGFEVRRALPSVGRQMVGPFIFFDQMGPAEFLTGQGIDVRPHPHIGLATVTYLLKGRMHHRDSLGTDQWITPGEVNLMTAGHGITHSERTDGPMRAAPEYLVLAVEQAAVALDEGEVGLGGFFAEQRGDCLAREQEGVEIAGGLPRGVGQPGGIDVVWPLFERPHVEAAPGEGAT
jgi:hypothetical protein